MIEYIVEEGRVYRHDTRKMTNKKTLVPSLIGYYVPTPDCVCNALQDAEARGREEAFAEMKLWVDGKINEGVRKR